ncbi:MAG: uL15 family ribosomal protein, partial [bacterium]|nr:uL15 family ribosomal protein [bacterium]
FKSRVGKTVDQICLSELEKLTAAVIDLDVLRQEGLITSCIKDVKVILSGELTKVIKLKGLRVTKGARIAIEGLGGSIEE